MRRAERAEAQEAARDDCRLAAPVGRRDSGNAGDLTERGRHCADPADDLSDLFVAVRPGAVRFAYVLTGSSSVADELVADAFAQVVRRWSELHEPRAYLYRAIVSGARSWGRRRWRTYALDAPSPIDIDSDAFAVRTVLAELPMPQRAALVLRYFVGLTDPEVADALDVPLGTAKSHIRRGLAAMRKELT